MWLSVFFRLPAWPFLWPAAAVLAFTGRRWVWLAVILTINPLVWIVLATTVQYATESPGLSHAGPGSGQHYQQYGRNPHPVTRLRYYGGHGRYYGDEWTYAIPRNITLLALTRVLGPPPNAYRGSYPTRTQAEAALTTADPVSAWDLGRDGNHTINLPGQPIVIDERQSWAIIEESAFRDVWDAHDERRLVSQYGPVRAALFGPDCVIFEVPALLDPYTMQPTAQNRGIFLIDRHSGQVFAVYTTGNADLDRFIRRWGFPK